MRDATTTAAQAIRDNYWREYRPVIRNPDGSVLQPARHHADPEGAARAVVDAVRPLIVGEEHDRLRREIEALRGPLEAESTDMIATNAALDAVLALLGESTKEEA